MNAIPNGVYGIVDTEWNDEFGAVGVLAFLTRRFSWFSSLYHLNDRLEQICIEPTRSHWRWTRTPRYVRFVGTNKVYLYRGSSGIWHGRSRSLLIPITHPAMREQ